MSRNQSFASLKANGSKWKPMKLWIEVKKLSEQHPNDTEFVAAVRKLIKEGQ